MITTYQQTLEITKNLEEKSRSLRDFLLSYKIKVLRKGILIPDNLIAELEDYNSRNSLIEPSKSIIQCCPSCLKAHALKKSNELGLDKESILRLTRLLEGKIGHNGYYLDKGELIEI